MVPELAGRPRCKIRLLSKEACVANDCEAAAHQTTHPYSEVRVQTGGANESFGNKVYHPRSPSLVGIVCNSDQLKGLETLVDETQKKILRLFHHGFRDKGNLGEAISFCVGSWFDSRSLRRFPADAFT